MHSNTPYTFSLRRMLGVVGAVCVLLSCYSFALRHVWSQYVAENELADDISRKGFGYVDEHEIASYMPWLFPVLSGDRLQRASRVIITSTAERPFNFETLKGFKSLEGVTLYECQLTSGQWNQLTTLPRLREVRLLATSISKEDRIRMSGINPYLAILQ